MKALIVCECNLNRSPTVAKFVKQKKPDWDIRSAGTRYGYPYMVNQELLDWANLIFCMDLEQYLYIKEHFTNKDNFIYMSVIGISDQYDPDDQRLINLLERYFATDNSYNVFDAYEVIWHVENDPMPEEEL